MNEYHVICYRSASNSMLVSGFRDEYHIVHDITGNYTVAKYACGGWKRPWGAWSEVHPSACYKVW